MKRIYTTLALIGAMVTGAFAQRTVDIKTVMVLPDPTQLTTLGCLTTDSLTMNVIVTNQGPSSLVAGDTFWYSAPWVDPGYISGFIIDTTINQGDTITAGAFKLGYTEIAKLWDPADGSDVAQADFVNDSTYLAFFYAARIGGVTSTVTETNDTNNFDIAAVKFVCNNTTGIKDLKNGVSLNVYPNPATNQISFNYDFTAATEASLRVTDISGRVVKTITLGKQNAGSKTFNVDIAELNNGMYYIELATETTRSISKFTKN